MKGRNRGIRYDCGLSIKPRCENLRTCLLKNSFCDENGIGAVGEINGNLVHARSLLEIVLTEKNCFFPQRVE